MSEVLTVNIKDWWVAVVVAVVLFIDTFVKIYHGQYEHAFDVFIGFMGWAGFAAYKHDEQVASSK